MEYFVVRPDYAVLARYYGISIPPEDLSKLKTYDQRFKYLHKLTKQQSKNGIELMIEAYFKDGKLLFDGDHVKFVVTEFEKILSSYGITGHRDNLLFMIVTLVQSIDTAFNYLQSESYEFQQRLKELSGFMYNLKNKPNDKTFQLALRSKDRLTNKSLDTITITDQKLIEWMTRFVIEAIDSGRGPVHLFGVHENAMLRKESSGPTTLRELRSAASITNNQTFESKNKQTIGRFCLTLIPYLDGETHLRVAEGKSTNDKQLKFLYEICILFNLLEKQFDADVKDVTPERYMRMLLKDTKKSLGRNMVEKQE